MGLENVRTRYDAATTTMYAKLDKSLEVSLGSLSGLVSLKPSQPDSHSDSKGPFSRLFHRQN